MTIINRVYEIISYSGVSANEFSKNLGVSNGYFAKQKKTDSNIGSQIIEKIVSKIPEINPEWLLTGKGEMLRSVSPATAPTASPATALREGIPLIPTNAMAGFLNGDSPQIMEYECERYVIPHFKDAEFLIAVKGSSMYPKYSSGDIVACKRLSLDTFFQWNKVYVLDTEQGALIKRVNIASNAENIKLSSDNPAYPPFDISREKINAIALVIGVIRLE